MTASLAIRHEPQARRFVADTDGGPAYITYGDRQGQILDLNSTYVPPAARGGGIASQLAAHALQYARARGYRVAPTCPFVADYVARHAEYRDLLVSDTLSIERDLLVVATHRHSGPV